MGEYGGPLCMSSDAIAALEDMQYVTGVGPCHDAFSTSLPELVTDLDAAAEIRWPAFVELARNVGIGSVFAFPLLSGSSRVGVLTLYGEPGQHLDATRVLNALALSDVLAEILFSVQEDSPVGVLAPALSYVARHRAEVFQAAGMVAVQLKIHPDEALVRIRAHSFAAGRQLALVAADIIGLELFLQDDGQQPTGRM